jgi:hypothetical protein
MPFFNREIEKVVFLYAKLLQHQQIHTGTAAMRTRGRQMNFWGEKGVQLRLGAPAK